MAGTLSAAASTHRLATYNIRYTADPGSSTDTEGKDWGVRGPVCRDVILNYGFDIVGFQEICGTGRKYRNPVTNRTQLDDLKAWLPGYELIAWDRDGTKRLEYVAIAFKKDRYELLEQGSFFISPTPDKYSMGWDTHIESHSRILGWLKLKDKTSGEQFIYACTHTNDGWSLDGPYGSQLVAKRMKEIAGNLPVMVVADYNTSRLDRDRKGLKAYHAAFHDAALDVPADKNYSLPASNRQVDWTYNAFNPASNVNHTGREIDFQFYRGMNILERHIVTEEFTYNGVQYPSSDHFPVYVVAELAPVTPKPIYVDCNAGNGGDGSAAAPFNTIKDAIAISDIDDTIHLTAGTYNESVQPRCSVSIFGGYTDGFTKIEGTSVISGKGLQYPPVYASGEFSLSLKNLTICDYTSPDNMRDGAILFRGSDLRMENLVVENNTAVDYGGGLSIYNLNTSKYCECNNVSALDCIFRNNIAKYGAAVAAGFYSSFDIDGCTFENNVANKSGAGIYLTFGTPETSRIWFTEAEALIVNSSFVGNTSKGSGTVVLNDEMPNVKVTVANTTFAGNKIDAKGGLANVVKGYGGTALHAKMSAAPADAALSKVKDSKIYLGHVTIVGNHANCSSTTNFKASALTVDGGEMKLVNSIIAANSTNGDDAYADITVSDPSVITRETLNIFTATTSVNFSTDEKTRVAAAINDGINAIADMFSGNLADNRFMPSILHADNEPTPFVPLKSTHFGDADVATLTVLQRNLENEFSTDIDRDGIVGTQTKTDQLRHPRNARSMPGAVEFNDKYSAEPDIVADACKDVSILPLPEGGVRICADKPLGTVSAADLTGKVISYVTTSSNQLDLDISGVSTGVYIIICLGNSYKIIK